MRKVLKNMLFLCLFFTVFTLTISADVSVNHNSNARFSAGNATTKCGWISSGRYYADTTIYTVGYGSYGTATLAYGGTRPTVSAQNGGSNTVKYSQSFSITHAHSAQAAYIY